MTQKVNQPDKIAAAYIRVSTNDQAEYSPDAQLRAINEYCARNGYVLPQSNVFADEGISGKTAAKRPAFQRMVALAKSKDKPFDAIVVHRFDRFARSREDSIVYKSLLRKEYGVKVISVTENIEDDKFAVILEAMLEAMAEYYSLNLADEVKKGMTEKARRGEPLTIAPFGYRMDDKKLLPHAEQAEIVKDIFAKYLSGVSMFQIAKGLNAYGVRTNRGNRVDNRFIEYILQNPVYIGKIRWNPTGKTRRNYGHPDLMIVDGGHEPLIPLETWAEAQRKLQTDRAQRPPHNRAASASHWLVGLVKCGNCGKGLVRNGRDYLQCRGYAGGTCGVSHALRIPDAERVIAGKLVADGSGAVPLHVSVDGGKAAAAPHIDKALNLCQRRLERFKEAYSAGIDTLEEYGRNKAVITTEIERLEKEKTARAETPEPVLDYDKIRLAIRSTARILADPAKSDEEKRQSANTVISHIIYDKYEKTLDLVYKSIV
jgi:DNA invertase Pin-like site-specific DNA recombinase